MSIESIFHQPYGSFAFPISENKLRIRIRARKKFVTKITVLLGDRYQPIDKDIPVVMEKIATDDLFDYFECDLYSETRRVRYTFYIQSNEQGYWYGDKGISNNRLDAGDFQFPYINEQDLFQTPNWAYEGIIYQIFPDRFANGNKKNDPINLSPWGATPKYNNFFGGDLEGIIEKLPYLDELGINVIYMTPIFESPSNHKYDTKDYYNIDPQFGDIETLKKLVKESHERGIKIVLDAVFNHCGYEFFAFQDVVKNGEKSIYKDWFYIDSLPVVTKPHPNYETFANDVWTMPKLRTSNPEVKEYLLNVAQFWMEDVEIDGWRLDVSNEVDHDFWREFRKVVKKLNSDALIVGEIWHDASPWLEGDQYDSVMNYLFKDALYDFFAKRTIGVEIFDARLTKARMKYKDQASYTMFNLIDSHDTERFLTSSLENEERLKLAALFQFTYIGMPMIYYGTEIGMTGYTDPDCRRTMIWDIKEQNQSLFNYYKRLITIRKANKPLTFGNFRTVIIDEINQIYGFSRSYNNENILIIINHSSRDQILKIPIFWDTKQVNNLLTNGNYPVQNKKIEIVIDGYQGAILK